MQLSILRIARAAHVIFVQTRDVFFDSEDMEKFADEGTMEDDMDGES